MKKHNQTTDTNRSTSEGQQSEESDNEDLASTLAELQDMPGVTTVEGPGGSFKIYIDLQTAEQFLNANGISLSQEEFAAHIAQQVADIANVLKIIQLLAMYLVLKKATTERSQAASPEQARAFFEEHGFNFVESIVAAINDPNDPDDLDETDTAADIATRKQKFSEFVRDINPNSYNRLYDLYARSNNVIIGLTTSLSFSDLLTEHKPQVQDFLAGLKACFVDHTPVAAAYFVSAEETAEGRSVLVPAQEEQNESATPEPEEEVKITEIFSQVLEKFLWHFRQLDLGVTGPSLAFSRKREAEDHDDSGDPNPRKYPRPESKA